MNSLWMNDIIATEKEKSIIRDWCEQIGWDRYQQLYLITKSSYGVVDYKNLTECVKYDAKLSQVVFKSIKYVENYIKAILCNKFGNEVIHRKTYLYDINRIIGQNKKQLDCSENLHIKKDISIIDFLDRALFSTLIKIFEILPEEIKKTYNVFNYNQDELKINLEAINDLRNRVSHNKLIVGDNLMSCYINGNKKKDLKSNVINVLNHLPNKDMVIRRINEINGLSTYKTKENNSSNVNNIIAIYINDNEVKSL